MAKALLSTWFILVPVALCVCDGRVVADFNITGNFLCGVGGNFLCKRSTQSTDGVLDLARPRTVGAAFYTEPVYLPNASFNITFSLHIKKEVDNGAQGDGMAFVMFVNSSWEGTRGGNLGLSSALGVPGTRTVAVEFDTYKNNGTDDLDDNHVGLDYGSIRSKIQRSLSDLNIHLITKERSYRLYVWIDYDSLATHLAIRVSISDRKPAEAFIEDGVSLNEKLGDMAYVGFTAVNGVNGSSYYTVYDMSLTTLQLEQSRGDMAIEPDPQPSNLDRSGTAKPEQTDDAHDRHVVPVIAFAAVGVAFVLLLCAIYILCKARSWRQSARLSSTWSSDMSQDDLGSTLPAFHPKRYSYKQLDQATNSFCSEEKLGSEKQGNVYRGLLSNGNMVAVKKLEFEVESIIALSKVASAVYTLTQVRHRNVIQLLGWCKEKHRLLLVYEYIARGNLEKALFCDGNTTSLSWSVRHKVLVEVAAALDYLHEGWTEKIIHRNIKCSNIMLDLDYEAKVGDFGLARMFSHHSCLYKKPDTVDEGICGFQAPEVTTLGKFTDKSDVYAFGVVALEVACGKRILDDHLPNNQKLLKDWVGDCLRRGHLLQAADERLGGLFDESEMKVVLMLGLLCTNPDPHARPAMSQAVQILSGDLPLLKSSSWRSFSNSMNNLPQVHS